MNPFISVIVPVYQVEKYIVECLESIERQTFDDYEVIIVNDGSKDRSEEYILTFLSGKDPNKYRYVKKENGGLSSARNEGMRHATGEWLFFLDSDDWLEEDALFLLARCAGRGTTDLVWGGIRAVDNETRAEERWSNYLRERGTLPADFDEYHSFEFCWGRLYRRAIVEENQLRFDERIKYAEDNAWQFDYVKFVQSYSCTNGIVYNYRTNRVGALTYTPATPQDKRHIWEHMCGFIDAFREEDIISGIKSNASMSRVMWSVLSTAVINDILDNNPQNAKDKKKTELAKAIRATYRARTKKDKIFMALWDGPFVLLRIFVCMYYRHFETIRKTTLVRILSKGK